MNDQATAPATGGSPPAAGKQTLPAVEGWFTLDGDGPALLATRCRACGTYYFPAQRMLCRHPSCSSRELDDVELSRTGTIWSFTDNRYQPPPPYVSAEPFEPFGIAAVELAAEKLVVLGQLAAGTDVSSLHAGDEVELVVEVLYSDDDADYTVWRWRPTGAGGGANASNTTQEAN